MTTTYLAKQNLCDGMKISAREIAIERINNTPELRSFKHLQNYRWDECNIFWEWIANAPIREFQTLQQNMTPAAIKNRAYHEAGHAIAAYFTYMDIRFATIMPSPNNYAAGEVIADVDEFPSTSYFGTWRLIVFFLSGSAAAEIFSEKLLDGFNGDVADAISYIRLLVPDRLQEDFLNLCFRGVYKLLLSPKVWEAVSEVAGLFLKYGTLTKDQIASVADKKVLSGSGSRVPEIIKCIKKVQDETSRITDCSDDIKSQRNWQIFSDVMRNQLSGRQLISEKLYNRTHESRYWRLDLDDFLKYKENHDPLYLIDKFLPIQHQE